MQLSELSTADVAAIRERNPEAFRPSLWKRLAVPIGVAVACLYIAYCSWFFSISKVMEEANWQVAGEYLYDWFSYEVRPDIDYRDGEIRVDFPRFSPLGENPDPDWIETRTGAVTVITQKKAETSKPASQGSFMAPSSAEEKATDAETSILDNVGEQGFSFMVPGASSPGAPSHGEPQTQPVPEEPEVLTVTRQGIAEATVRFDLGTFVEITPELVTVTHAGEKVEFAVSAQENTVKALGALPVWALQKREDAKVFLDFGFIGRAEVRARETKIARRYLGWENFFFDTNSRYWGMSWGAVGEHLLVGPQVAEGRSNWSVLWDNIINNAEWQHGDVWIKLLQTIVMAFVGTLFALLVAFPLSFLAARNITPNVVVNQILKRFFDFLRSVDMLIWALFFTRAFGPGPLAGISAIFFTDTGTFGKLYSEALENIDEKQREGIRSVGAGTMQIQRFGVIPQVLPIFISQALYFWESNTRSATIIGAVGAGGIGLKLWEAMRTNQDWENVAYMVILILIVVFIFDNVSNALRSRLIGKQG